MASHAPQAVTVFVRVRPLTPEEVSKGAEYLPGLQLQSNDAWEDSASAFEASGSIIDGFSGVLGKEALNTDVFERCFAPNLQTVLRGGTASLFCYGYTGSGKTHTVIGYGQERGMYYQAAERLLHQLNSSVGAAEADRLFLRATACEMHNDQVLDLLGPNKVPCTLRVDEKGQLQILGPQTSDCLPPEECGMSEELLSPEQQKSLRDSTLVTRSAQLRSADVFKPEDLEAISGTCVQKRAVGTSTEHAQSSRSHALLRMEVVNADVVKALAKLEEALAMLPARKSALDNVSLALRPNPLALDKSPWHYLLYSGFKMVLAPPGDHAKSGPYGMLEKAPNGSYILANGQTSTKMGCELQGYEHLGIKSVEEWAHHFGFPKLEQNMLVERREYGKPGKWEEVKAMLEAKEHFLQRLLEEAQSQVDNASRNLEQVKASGPAALGGCLILVDLAGADYDHRSGEQQKESAAINKSLLSLKECLRSLAKVDGAKPKFRDSKLTRLLEDALQPTESGCRRSCESTSVMLVNVSPSEHLAKMTLNTLRYGQLFAATSDRAGTVKKAPRPSLARQRPQRQTDVTNSAPRPCDPKLREELIAIYREHCPEKSEHEVQTILYRFAGREAELLQKARDKYVNGCS